jgi:hypothetical protein
VGRGALGPAAEQFLEQTPWANPNHPVHRMGQQSHQLPHDPVGVGSALYAGPPGGRRHSHQPGGWVAAGGFMNGEAVGSGMHKSLSGGGHEHGKMKGRVGVEGVKREGVLHA